MYFSNFMDVTNKGVEISIGGDIIRNEDFVWSMNVNWAFNRNNLQLMSPNINFNPIYYKKMNRLSENWLYFKFTLK